jgi:predicted P-loop ATPase
MNSSTEVASTIKHNGELTIAVGKSRFEKEWKNRTMFWSQLVEKLTQTTRTRETLAEYDTMTKVAQDEIKDVGGFVGGTLKGGRRTVQTAAWRQVVTLDADFANATFWDDFTLLNDYAALIYSTHKHRPAKPRYRLCIPLKRAVSPDEYQALSRKLAEGLGMDLFDDTTYQAHRLMYWPSTSSDAEFYTRFQDGPWLDPDAVLALYPDWTDQSFWPESSRTKQARQKMAEKQGDPTEKHGIIGTFCRTYSITAAIDTFLADVYTACAMEGRYTYSLGTSSGGLVLYEDKFAYSHHGTDPISSKLVNAFDLVRLHKFGDLDNDVAPGTPTVKLPSYMAMIDLCRTDDNVKQTFGEEKLAEAQHDFEGEEADWLKKLELSVKGGYESNPYNVILILKNDPNLAGKFALDEFAHRIVLKDNLPWRVTDQGRFWQDGDDSGLRNYCNRVYGIKGNQIIADALNEVLYLNYYHPVRDYLSGLWWDGQERIDKLLIDYLGAEDTEYVRTVTRKMLVAAVARVTNPGVKFDTMLVLVGKQGEGKSYLLKKLGGDWFSDSLTTVNGKEAYEQLQGFWILEMGELSALKRAEVEAVKHFLSKQVDNFRVAYGRNISTFPRQCVFFGSTNRDDFLRDATGNRRFWPVKTRVQPNQKSVFTDLTEYEIGQIWAEASQAWQAGEALHLDPRLNEQALAAQERHMEESDKFGQVQEYLERKLPADWEQRDLGQRKQFLYSDFGEEPEGTVERTRVCALEIWVECLNGDTKTFNALQSREIKDIMYRMPGWELYDGKLRFGKIYGLQRCYIKKF